VTDSGFYSRRVVWSKPPKKPVSRLAFALSFAAGFVIVLVLAYPDSAKRWLAEMVNVTLWRGSPKPARLSESELSAYVLAASEQHGVPAGLLWAMIAIESDFRHEAVSPRGAMGLMQLTSSTAERFKVLNPYDPAENINAGAQYISGLLKRYKGRKDLALAAYNAGPEAVKKYHGIPPFRETRQYVIKVLDEFKRRAS